MKKLFIHNPLFRLLSPVFSGVVVYLLILLVNNNVQQLQEQFLGQELYVCIAMSYIIQEFSRLLLLFFKRLPSLKNQPLQFTTQIIISMLLCVILVTFSITLYYEKIIGFSPNKEELRMFNTIFSAVAFIYVLLFISHQYLHKINTEKLSQELLIKQNIQEDFNDFKAGINPNLLFESFETLLILIKQNKEKADDFIDYLSSIYRYILSSKKEELVVVNEEVTNAEELIKLFNELPYRDIQLTSKITSNFFIVPQSLLFLIEQIVRSTIISSDIKLVIQLQESEHYFEISYFHNDKITHQFNNENLAEINRVYSVYSNENIQLKENSKKRTIFFPKLTITTKQ